MIVLWIGFPIFFHSKRTSPKGSSIEPTDQFFYRMRDFLQITLDRHSSKLLTVLLMDHSDNTELHHYTRGSVSLLPFEWFTTVVDELRRPNSLRSHFLHLWRSFGVTSINKKCPHSLIVFMILVPLGQYVVQHNLIMYCFWTQFIGKSKGLVSTSRKKTRKVNNMDGKMIKADTWWWHQFKHDGMRCF